jgi:putative GTP pyrophosphokinase
MADIAKLKSSYDELNGRADSFRKALLDQLNDLFEQHSLRPALPIESRTKKWPAILRKTDRLSEKWEDVRRIWDLIGFRLVFLLPDEAAYARGVIENTFDVTWQKDLGSNLLPHEFGYRSVHYTVRLLPQWLAVPSLRSFGDFLAELQVRTLSQHNWAAASRNLQYEDPNFAPPDIRRSLFRLAALLEVVDLELRRVQVERAAYKEQISDEAIAGDLNADVLDAILQKYLPSSHREPNEDLTFLLRDLNRSGISTGKDLVDLIDKHLAQALINETAAIREVLGGNPTYEAAKDRASRGVFYNHVGLMQNILYLQFGLDWRKRRSSAEGAK